MENFKTTFKFRRDTIENWETLNPILEQGEPGIAFREDGTSILKIGDGITEWNSLSLANVDFNFESENTKLSIDTINDEIDTLQTKMDLILDSPNDDTINSVKELVEWVEEHGSEADEMANSITANKEAIAKINDENTGILAQAKDYTDNYSVLLKEENKAFTQNVGDGVYLKVPTIFYEYGVNEYEGPDAYKCIIEDIPENIDNINIKVKLYNWTKPNDLEMNQVYITLKDANNNFLKDDDDKNISNRLIEKLEIGDYYVITGINLNEFQAPYTMILDGHVYPYMLTWCNYIYVYKNISKVNGEYSGTIGRYNLVDAKDAYAIGYNNEINLDSTYGFATGCGNVIHGKSKYSTVSGYGNYIDSPYSTAEGRLNKIFDQTGYGSNHVEGFGNSVNGSASHAQGLNTQANGTAAFSAGENTKANARAATALGTGTQAYGVSSAAIGTGLYIPAKNVNGATYVGRYNNYSTTSERLPLFVVGNGVHGGESGRSNILEIYDDCVYLGNSSNKEDIEVKIKLDGYNLSLYLDAMYKTNFTLFDLDRAIHCPETFELFQEDVENSFTEINSKLENLEIPEYNADLSNYYTKQETNTEIEQAILEAQLGEIDGESVKNYVDEQIPIIKTGSDMFVQKINGTSNFYKEYNEFDENEVYSEFNFRLDNKLKGAFKLILNYPVLTNDHIAYLYDSNNNVIPYDHTVSKNDNILSETLGTKTIWYNLNEEKQLGKIVFKGVSADVGVELPSTAKFYSITIQTKGSYIYLDRGAHSGAIGRYNVINNEDSYAMGYSNKIYDEKSNAFGQGNLIGHKNGRPDEKGVIKSGNTNFACGRNNQIGQEVLTHYSFSSGYNNQTSGSYSSVFGYDNKNEQGIANIIFGHNNTISGKANKSFISGDSSQIIEETPNDVGVNSVHLLGNGLQLTQHGEDKYRHGRCVVGSYNKDDLDAQGALFTVGGGYHTTDPEITVRENAFMIKHISNDADNVFRMLLGDAEITSEELNNVKNGIFENSSGKIVDVFNLETPEVDLSSYAKTSEVYTKTEANNKFATKEEITTSGNTFDTIYINSINLNQGKDIVDINGNVDINGDLLVQKNINFKNKNGAIVELKEYISSYLPDLTEYVTQSDLVSEVNKLINNSSALTTLIGQIVQQTLKDYGIIS